MDDDAVECAQAFNCGSIRRIGFSIVDGFQMLIQPAVVILQWFDLRRRDFFCAIARMTHIPHRVLSARHLFPLHK
jgi:hypothetical protein